MLFRRAMSRLDDGERERERRVAPYSLSLHALAGCFAEAGTRQGWYSPGEGTEQKPVLVALSGGGDSTATLWLFRTLYEGPVIAAHVNHGLRGAESDEDAAFARQRAEAWGLPFLERQVDVGPGSLETEARKARFAALSGMAEECGAGWIALGHNRDDLAETVLFNLLRGSGTRGSIGMPERRGPFIRPVLGLRRKFLREILSVRGISWREDRTNALTEAGTGQGYTRNFLRLELLPLIERRVNAGAVEHLAAFAEAMRAPREEEEQRGKALLKGVLAAPEGAAKEGLSLNREGVAALPSFDRLLLLREAGRRLGVATLSRQRAEELARLMGRQGPFTFQWGGGLAVLGLRREICFKQEEF